MTTRVTIDAHAGWPVQVVTMQGEGVQTPVIDIVQPNTQQDFFLHSGCRIVDVQELPRPVDG